MKSIFTVELCLQTALQVTTKSHQLLFTFCIQMLVFDKQVITASWIHLQSMSTDQNCDCTSTWLILVHLHIFTLCDAWPTLIICNAQHLFSICCSTTIHKLLLPNFRMGSAIVSINASIPPCIVYICMSRIPVQCTCDHPFLGHLVGTWHGHLQGG